jgi:hypothetical protein
MVYSTSVNASRRDQRTWSTMEAQMKFEFRHDVFLHFVAPQPDTTVLAAINNLKEIIMNAIENLDKEVAENTDVVASAVTLLNNIAAELAAAKDDPVKIQALADKLSNNTDALAASVAANTKVDPTLPGNDV